MSNFLEHISISNFKSIKACDIDGCKRINLFIGRPNVGKSNILEALSLFSIPYLKNNKFRNLSSLVRIENETELFRSGYFDEPINIITNYGELQITYDQTDGIKFFLGTNDGMGTYTLDEKLNIKIPATSYFESAIKRYTFSNKTDFAGSPLRYLLPPFGNNLLNVIERDRDLKDQIVQMFKEYNLKLVFDKASQSLKILQASNSRDEIFLIPYNSIADTLQRIIFYKSAIASNKNSILLFEEPEAHSFPPYMSHLTQEMIYKTENQYFVATHSPFILNDLLENGREDLAVFIVNYEHNETVVRKLGENELHEVFQNGIDLFTNSESFI
ncbi:MAG: hypothetical protein EON51_02290 [Acinetobacter sp.]|nr:MAG: hypothetical protein EON51_02290 [Acinetobacter sp.]